MRAESFFNVASYVDLIDASDSYGGRSLHDQSHGESFLSLATHRFRGQGLYLLDEPESALSPTRQLALLRLMHLLIRDKRSQFIIATHSPILMGYPEATIYHFSDTGIIRIAYEETEHYQITYGFLSGREAVLRQLFSEEA